MKRLSQQKKQKIIKLEKLYKESHILMNKIQTELIEQGFDEDILQEELLSLKVGDSTAQDFINYIEEELEYLKN